MNDETMSTTGAPVVEPKHVRGSERFEVVDLEWPVEYDGKVYDKITVTRMSTTQVADYTERMATDSGLGAIPMFDAPRAVIEALDADDTAKLDEVAFRFLPRAFRGAGTSTSGTGADTSGSPQPGSADNPSPG